MISIWQKRRTKYLKSAQGHDLKILLGQLVVSSEHFSKYKLLLRLDVYQSKIRYDYLPYEERADLKRMLAEIRELLKEVEEL